MKDGTVTLAEEKKSLNDMLVTKNILLDNIYENFGEMTEEQSDQLLELEVNIPTKVDGWAWTLKKDGAIDKEIELWQNRKEVIDRIIHALKNGKDRLKARAHFIMDRNNLERIDGNQFWIKKEFSRSKSIIMDLVEDEYKKYELPTLNYKQYSLLKEIIAHFNGTLEKELPFDTIYTALELQQLINDEKKEKCNVSDLPVLHDAIVIEEKETVRIYPKR